MDWIAIVVVAVILIPLAIFILRRLAGLIALGLGIVGILCLISKNYIAGIVLILIAALLAKFVPPDDGDDYY